MLFGRQTNMQRRRSRPHESYHRDMRRKGVDRAAMLEASKGVRPKRSFLERLLARLLGR